MRFRNAFIVTMAAAMVLGGASMVFGMGKPDTGPMYNNTSDDATGLSSVPSVTMTGIYEGRPIPGTTNNVSSGTMSVPGDTTGVSGDTTGVSGDAMSASNDTAAASSEAPMPVLSISQGRRP